MKRKELHNNLDDLRDAVDRILKGSGVDVQRKKMVRAMLPFMGKVAILDLFRALAEEADTLYKLGGQKKRVKLQYDIVSKYMQKKR